MGDYNDNNRYGVEERARKQALPFIENKTAQAEPVHYRLNNNNEPWRGGGRESQLNQAHVKSSNSSKAQTPVN